MLRHLFGPNSEVDLVAAQTHDNKSPTQTSSLLAHRVVENAESARGRAPCSAAASC